MVSTALGKLYDKVSKICYDGFLKRFVYTNSYINVI